MNIVLLADNRKNELLTNFCIAYRQILARHEIYSVANTAKIISENTNLNIQGATADMHGSFEHFVSRVMFNEIDAVIYLRDPFSDSYNESNKLLKACDTNQIPYATNIATAEIIILAIDRGDLDWRQLLR